MKPKTFGLVSDSAIADFVNFVNPIWRQLAKDGTPIVIKISTKSEDYSSAQRRLYFMWCGQFAKHQGDDKDSIHHDFKKRFLIAIYRRDDADFNEMCESIAVLKESEPAQYKAIAEGVIKLVSITKASKAQMAEYMNDIYHFCIKQNCYLQTPDDLRFAREMAA